MPAHITLSYLGTTGDGLDVYDREDSHFHPEGGLTLELLQEGLQKINFPKKGDFHKFVLNFHRTIGYSTCVKVTEDDDVVMVYRKGRAGMTPMVKNRVAEPCECLIIILRKDIELPNHATLITAFIGAASTPEPWDKRLRKKPHEKAKAEEFWSTHALLYNEALIDWEKTTA